MATRDGPLVQHRHILVKVAEALLEVEVLDAEQLNQIVEGRPLEVRQPKPTVTAPPAAAAREGKVEGERAGGILPPPMAAPKPTS